MKKELYMKWVCNSIFIHKSAIIILIRFWRIIYDNWANFKNLPSARWYDTKRNGRRNRNAIILFKSRNDKRGIDADLLIKLLTAHHFDVVGFFSRLSNQSKNQYNSYYEIEAEITFAKNTKNLAKLKKIETKLNQKDNDLPSWLKFRSELAYAWVTHSNDHISTELKAKVKSLIVGEDWDRKHPASDPFTLQFVSWIAVNFLIAATMRRRMNLTCGSQLSF